MNSKDNDDDDFPNLKERQKSRNYIRKIIGKGGEEKILIS